MTAESKSQKSRSTNHGRAGKRSRNSTYGKNHFANKEKASAATNDPCQTLATRYLLAFSFTSFHKTILRQRLRFRVSL